MNKLESPRDFPGLGMQRHHGICPFVIAKPQTAIVIRACAARGNEHQIALEVHRHNRPSVSRATSPRIRRICFIAVGRIPRNGIPTPPQGTRTCIERPHHSSRHVHPMVVIDGRSYHYEIVNYRRWRGHVIPPREIAGHFSQANLAAIAKIRAGFARRSVQGNESSVLCRFKNPSATRFPGGPRRVQPSARATVHQSIAVVQSPIDQGIISPSLFSSGGVKRDHSVERRRDIQRAVHKNRRSFKAASLFISAAFLQLARMKDPRNLELAHIVAIDLRQR